MIANCFIKITGIIIPTKMKKKMCTVNEDRNTLIMLKIKGVSLHIPNPGFRSKNEDTAKPL